ncbi:MAG: hypothetical protein V4724_18650 [Pseudomonadota bacterium]
MPRLYILLDAARPALIPHEIFAEPHLDQVQQLRPAFIAEKELAGQKALPGRASGHSHSARRHNVRRHLMQPPITWRR